jgi:hypothetical protein
VAGGERVAGEGEHRIRHGDVEMAALPGAVTLAQAEQNVDHRRQGAAADVGDQRGRHDRPVGRAGVERKEPSVGYVVEIVPGLAGARAGLAVAGDRAIDQPRVDRAHRIVAEAEPSHDPGAELLHQHVGAPKKSSKLVGTVFSLEVECKTGLSAV